MSDGERVLASRSTSQSHVAAIWAAVLVAGIGRQVTFLALPLIAVLTLEASPGEMGLLTAIEALPALTLSLFVGVLVDRTRKRPLLVAANVLRMAALLIIPLLWLTDSLTYQALVVVVFLSGACACLFDIALRSYVPLVVERARLLHMNSRIELGRSAAEIGGPALAGVLVQIVAAPLALLADVSGRLCAIGFLLLAPRDEPAPRPAVVDEPRWYGAFAGLRLIRSSPLLAPTAGALAMAGFFNGAIEAVFVIFVVRNLGLEPFVVGAIFACGSVGFIIGALLPERLAARIGLGWSLVATLALVGVSDLAVALAAGPTPFVVGLLAVAQMLFGIGLTAFGANEVTLRQSVTAESTLGRVNAAFYVLSSGSAPFGALAGGALGSALGVRYALLLAAAGEVLAVLPLLTGRFRMAAGSFASSPLSEMAQD